MHVLHLKRLVIYGFCSGPDAWNNKNHKTFMESMFKPAVAKDGELEFRDNPVFEMW
jgi:hypothetical protein